MFFSFIEFFLSNIHDLIFYNIWRNVKFLAYLTEFFSIFLFFFFFQEHVVQFIDYFEGEQQSVILTEYLEGGELFQRISSPDYNLTEAKCRDFTRQILKAVDFIHSRRIIHLDLKPQNIVLCRKPSKAANGSAAQENANLSKELKCCDELKIIDFGLARALGKFKKN